MRKLSSKNRYGQTSKKKNNKNPLLSIRHVLVSSGPNLTADQWEVCGVACHRACSNSLQELHQLTMAFSPRSESFYGDAAQVKVAARRDTTAEESERLRQLAAQVRLSLPSAMVYSHSFSFSSKTRLRSFEACRCS